MSAYTIQLQQKEPITLYGLWRPSNDRTTSRDISDLSLAYHAAAKASGRVILPYFVLSRDYDPATGNYSLFIGSTFQAEGLEPFTLPAGTYASVTIRPSMGLFWGRTIGKAKRYFYQTWLPASDYEPLNMEYELHTQRSIQKHPTVDLLFAIRPRQQQTPKG